ncbi:MTOX-like protein [Mya arenaria]|uniref:MTOX-like protein n=2 Tax=Mya arenaria TaxID=6604 RepID=A0ABY7DGD2_MYAAR|nr:N-methyl-L-tryptophan oxidase-like isoform X2 [Mya arenaria]XP_052783131.1 N-methyl-L-tryptophan oxidase-like isoform X2 [Mya arenaria]XP_052783139.1 N-methyl-L-tryptophan oxidase-like isoform X2 [Mya arenaria]XP_052783147.1 N-methyl-L-tryptophan oxidase-like isoform X2 [Mya arenaria]XP_052783152.1 N-methyl-L-tryptophan oxidase-like isoform X2 [Mya arenaria]XP_052783159.1 N-methyl-L-tryptophan oxidase-like isoform X2 [Mya arenaria]XP_052783167.1 N-methyl-L-tryptophan oxidase-like isoform X
MYDLCVVGAGMIGSAAAKYATRTPNTSVCLIGQSELKNRADNGSGIWGAHYDESRVVRASDPDPIWTHLARLSVGRFREIEERSGIQFFHEVGTLWVGEGEYFCKATSVTYQEKTGVNVLNSNDLHSKYPYLTFNSKDNGVLEKSHAGYLNPRKLVQAQIYLAQKNGCDYLDDIVKSVSRENTSNGTAVMEVLTEKGKRVQCRKVLIATGAFTDFRSLLPGLKVQQNLITLTVTHAEITEEVAMSMLREMPCVLYSGYGHPDWFPEFPRYDNGMTGFYMTPPIRYPDDRYYVKLGHFRDTLNHELKSAREVGDLYKYGNQDLGEKTVQFMKTLLKGIPIKKWKSDSCVTACTPSGRPYIDMVHEQLGVAVGGNGFAAKSSDEIGRASAGMIINGWDSPLPHDAFKLRATPLSLL